MADNFVLILPRNINIKEIANLLCDQPQNLKFFINFNNKTKNL